MAALKPQVRSAFPTPLCTHYFAIAHEANAQWRPLVLGRMQAGRPRPEAGMGWRSHADFDAWGGMHVATLFRVLRELANTLTSTRAGGRVELNWRIAACAAVRQTGEHCDVRVRPGGFWSALYYVDDGYAKSDDPAFGGEVLLGDPRGPVPAIVAPELALRIPGGLTAGQNEIIRPQTGMIVLFPSWMPVGEKRFDGPNHRIAIEADLLPPAPEFRNA
ncbi:MAG: putative 2OG-Fe(II) oxygenase [Alphaproteobacteria bacterium]